MAQRLVDAAVARARQREELADAVVAEADRLWSGVDERNIRGSWGEAKPRVTTALAGAQLAAARGADDYVSTALAEQGLDADVDGRVRPRSLAGHAADGRPLGTLLDGPPLATLSMISQGAPINRAMATGQATLEMILRTEIGDAGRMGDQIAVTTRERTGYVRMIQWGACGRCAVLAGRFYRYNSGFLRHPNCYCVHVPTQEAVEGDLRLDVNEYFDSLSWHDQNRLFGKANAQAIRDGADPVRVVNATGRRGNVYTTDQGLKATREGARRGRQRGTERLTPEAIYQIAPNRREAIDLLRLHGYID